MKNEANGFGRRGVALACETIHTQTILTKTTKGDGLNLRPND